MRAEELKQKCNVVSSRNPGVFLIPTPDFLAGEQVNFGCVLNDTTMTKAVRITNNSVVNCAFSWSFLEDAEEGRQVATSRRPYIPVNQARGVIYARRLEDLTTTTVSGLRP